LIYDVSLIASFNYLLGLITWPLLDCIALNVMHNWLLLFL